MGHIDSARAWHLGLRPSSVSAEPPMASYNCRAPFGLGLRPSPVSAEPPSASYGCQALPRPRLSSVSYERRAPLALYGCRAPLGLRPSHASARALLGLVRPLPSASVRPHTRFFPSASASSPSNSFFPCKLPVPGYVMDVEFSPDREILLPSRGTFECPMSPSSRASVFSELWPWQLPSSPISSMVAPVPSSFSHACVLHAWPCMRPRAGILSVPSPSPSPSALDRGHSSHSRLSLGSWTDPGELSASSWSRLLAPLAPILAARQWSRVELRCEVDASMGTLILHPISRMASSVFRPSRSASAASSEALSSPSLAELVRGAEPSSQSHGVVR